MASSEVGTERTGGRALAPLGFGVSNLVSSALIVLGVFRGLPARYLVVDVPAAGLALLLAAAGVGLLGGSRFTRWARPLARIASFAALAVGLATITALAVSVAFLSGVQGALGSGGAVLFVLIIALLVPYLVALPSAQLLWLRRAGT